MTYRIANQSTNQSINQSINKSINIERLGNNVLLVMYKIVCACNTAFYAIICYKDIKTREHSVKFRVLQIPILETNMRIIYDLFISQILQRS